jgi:hypothetical protein
MFVIQFSDNFIIIIIIIIIIITVVLITTTLRLGFFCYLIQFSIIRIWRFEGWFYLRPQAKTGLPDNKKVHLGYNNNNNPREK